MLRKDPGRNDRRGGFGDRWTCVLLILCTSQLVVCAGAARCGIHAGILRLRGGSESSVSEEGSWLPKSTFRGDTNRRLLVPLDTPVPDLGQKDSGGAVDKRQTVRDLLNGPITLDQVDALREMGAIKGSWMAESEEEPSSDLREAQLAVGTSWPEEMVRFSSPPQSMFVFCCEGGALLDSRLPWLSSITSLPT